jgi:alkanesulfonate monooxygenase SsuD/methylene tetrahydromethanopterin reductase-like flavin-dependent oxidoreductase (luciferase family)
MIAKAAASLDVMSGGRFELGIGSGAFWQAVAGMGGVDRPAGERIAALEEAIRIIRAALDGERVVRGPGPHYPIPGYPPGPPPAHRIEIWIGARRPRTLDLIGGLADGWVPPFGTAMVGELPAAQRRIADAAEAAGLDPADVRTIVNVAGTVTVGERGGGALDGPVDQWVETLATWSLELGIDAFVVWPPDAGTGLIERFAAEVAPAVREAVRGDQRPSA